MNILSLPCEIYDEILGMDCLDVEDLISFRDTCTYLHYVCSTCVSNRVWRKHFFKRWPRLKRMYESFGLDQKAQFLDHSILRIKFRKEFNDFLLSIMHPTYTGQYMYRVPSTLQNVFYGGVDSFAQKDLMNYYFMLDEFVMIFRKQHLDVYERENCCDWCLMWEDHNICSKFEELSRNNCVENWAKPDLTRVFSLRAVLLQIMLHIRNEYSEEQQMQQRTDMFSRLWLGLNRYCFN